jgi:hypothetical protein
VVDRQDLNANDVFPRRRRVKRALVLSIEPFGGRLVRRSQQVPIPSQRHPFGSREMTLPGPARAARLFGRIDREDNASDLCPVGSIGLRIEKPEIDGEVFLIVLRQMVRVWRLIGYRTSQDRITHRIPSD